MGEYNDYEDVCMICRRTESQAGKMFKMPGGICLCSDCMRTTMDMANSMGFDPNMFGSNPFDFNSDIFSNLFGGNSEKSADNDEKNPFGFTSSNNSKKTSENGENGDNVSLDKSENADSANDAAYTKESSDDASDDAAGDKNNDGINDGKDNGKDDKSDDHEKKDSSQGGKDKRNTPKFSFINLGDFGPGGFMPRQGVKKKRAGEHKPLIALEDIPAPHEIKAKLDEYVVGQEHAKKVMSVAVYNHYKRVATDTMDEIEIEKSNILMIGPTGCGKTYLVKTLAKLLNVPLAIADATSLTEAGYIGDDIESVVSKLLAAADNDVDKAEQGIIYIDEIDKIAKKENAHSRDVSGESVQQGMLKLLEGSEVEVPIGASSKNAMVPTAIVNTKNILFICGGAFSGMEEIVKKRLSKQSGIGFKAELKDRFNNDKNILLQATIDDVKKFGMIPEFVGRLPMFFSLESMTEDMLVDILKEPKNAIIKQYQKLLKLDEVDLQFTDEALHAIAQKAMEKETGARGLRAVIDEFMLDIMYEIPKDDNIGTVTISKEYIEGNGGPIITMRGAE